MNPLKIISNFYSRLAYDFSSVQCDLPYDIAEEIYRWGKKNIPDSILDPEEDKARQPFDDIHVTIKYGIYIIDPTEIKSRLYNQKPIKMTLGPISIFDGETNDVVKIGVDSDDLFDLNEMIKENFETHDTFPTYNPHITIALVKKGFGAQYNGMDDFKGREIIMKSVTFSGKDNRKTLITLPRKYIIP